MKKTVFYFFAFVLLLNGLSSCSKSQNTTKILEVGTSYTKNGSYLYNSQESSITVTSGEQINFEISISQKNEVSKLELTRETAQGTQTGTLIPVDILENGQSYYEPVNVETKYTFILTTTSGKQETVGPIEVKVTNSNTVVRRESIIVTESNNAFQSYKFFAPLADDDNISAAYYASAFPNRVFNPKVALCFPYYNAGTGNTLLVSASQLSAKSAFAYLTSNYQNFAAVEMKPYNNSALISALDNSTISYASLDTINFSNPTTEIVATLNGGFIFRTAEGKKGIGKFTAVANNQLDILFAYQK